MLQKHINELRAFNRYYTRIIGLLDRYIVGSNYTLPEARILYELYHNENLLPSDIINAMDIDKGYLSRMLTQFDARIELKKQQGIDEKLMEKENKQDDDDDNTNRNYSSNYGGNYRVNSYVRRSSAGIGIDDYSVLLSPFYDTHAAIPKFFDKQLQSKDVDVQINAAILLIRNNKKVADSILLQIASKDKYRARLLSRLEEIKHTELFPAKYSNQDSVARAVLLNDKNEDKFYAIVLVGKQFITLNDQKGYVYFYKYKVNKDDEWHMGLSGIQPADITKVSANDVLTKMTGKKVKPGIPESQQFNEQLTRLIFQQHKSAQNFFEDDNDYSYLRRRYMRGNN